MRRVLPASAPRDVTRIVSGRGIRGFADGFVSVLLAQYLTGLGFSPGAGRRHRHRHAARLGRHDAGVRADRAPLPLRTLLLAATVIMVATGRVRAVTWFWPLMVVAVLGTLNPSAGDVSVFLPTEQAYVAGQVDAPRSPPPVRRLQPRWRSSPARSVRWSRACRETMAHRNGWDVVDRPAGRVPALRRRRPW